MGDQDLEYLKTVSRVKHRILEKYLKPWSSILGSANKRLGYFDCFAGTGAYCDEMGRTLPGSPLVAARWAKQFVIERPGHQVVLGFVEKDIRNAAILSKQLIAEGLPANGVSYSVNAEDAQDFTQRLVAGVRSAGHRSEIIPSFFFVDPYGHPITIPVLKHLLTLGKTELLVNLMYFRMKMHLHNSKALASIDSLFGSREWRTQRFMQVSGSEAEREFVDYFVKQLGARYCLRFLVHYSPEDRVARPESRTKYYLLHFSSHPKAALLMKRVMWSASDSLEGLEFSGLSHPRQMPLFIGQSVLADELSRTFAGQRLTFEEIQVRTLDWPYIESDYRAVLKQMASDGRVTIERFKMTGRAHGITGNVTLTELLPHE